ncbi:MAG: PEP-utilizing enzyme [Chloroflexota bacterium]|nr:PEP-utilizing enzyme [Chloroflexota bacterium]
MNVPVPTVSTSANQDWNEGIEAGTTWTFDPMHFPFPLSPLTVSTLGPCFANGATAAFRELHAPIEQVDVVHRNYYRYERWSPVIPAGDDEARRIGETAEASAKSEIARMMERWLGEHLPRISAHHQRIQEMPVESATPAELTVLIDELNAIHTDLWTIHFRVAIPMLLSMQLFDELYADLFDGEEADAHALLVGGLSESVKAGFGLSDLAIAATGLGLDSLFKETDPGSLIERLEASPDGWTLLGRLYEYLETYGLRQDLFEFSTPTWREDPSIALASIRSYIMTGRDARAEHEVMARSAELALATARANLAAYPEAVRNQFEAMVQFGRHGAFLQEEHNFYIDQRGMALIRLFYMRVGNRFVGAGLLQAPADIFLLAHEEIRQSVQQRFSGSAGNLRGQVDIRRAELASAGQLAPPPFIGDAPSGPPPADNPMGRALVRFFGGPPQDSGSPDQIKGNGGSRGVATGIARVARTLDEAKHVRPGEILVAVTTMPAWTPLFGVAAAVVAETGGPLSHCAIVAREYGLPAVVGAHGATTRIRTGQTITVDGGTGIVTLSA